MTDTEPTEDSLRDSLAAMDAGTYQEPQKEDKAEAVGEEEAPEPTALETKKEAPEPESGSSLKAEVSKDEKPKSKYEANKERQGRTWQEINAEKESVKAEKAALQAEKEALAKEREEIHKAKSQGEVYRNKEGISAKDYRDLAKRFLREGKENSEQMAEEAEKLADALVQEEQEHKSKRSKEELQKHWADSYAKLAEKNPDLKDKDSDLYKETTALLKAIPPLTFYKEGLEYAVAFAENKLKGGKYEATAAELKELKQKKEDLEKKLSISSGPPTSSPKDDAPKKGLSIKEDEKRLRQLVESHDKGAGWE